MSASTSRSDSLSEAVSGSASAVLGRAPASPAPPGASRSSRSMRARERAHVGVLRGVAARNELVGGAQLGELRGRARGCRRPSWRAAGPRAGCARGRPPLPQRAQVVAEGLLLELELLQHAQVGVELLGQRPPVLLLVLAQGVLALLERASARRCTFPG